jgi:hypothetical protein
MVQECCKWIFDGSITAKDEELKLIETLRTVTSGKIYVEVERARLTHKLAKMYEKDGQIAKAASTMHELQVISCLVFLFVLSCYSTICSSRDAKNKIVLGWIFNSIVSLFLSLKQVKLFASRNKHKILPV